MLKKNDIVKLDIENCTLQGSGVGRYDGLAVFVPMTARGDEIEAHILKVKSNCAFAKVHSVIKPSPPMQNAAGARFATLIMKRS